MKTLVDVLVEARSLIECPRWWTRDDLARDCNGVRVNPSGPRAYCWCALGAIVRAAGPGLSQRRAAALLFRRVIDGDIVTFNDASNHAEVLAKFDEAIALAKAEVSA